jgi:hypothetical protein
VVLRPQHVDPSSLEAALTLQQRLHARHLERDVIDPGWRIRIRPRWRRAGKIEERDVTAIGAFKEDVDEVNLFPIRLGALGGDFASGIFQAQDLGVEVDRLLRVATTIGDVMQLLEHDPSLPPLSSTAR